MSSVLAEQASPEGRNVDSFLQGKREGVPNYLQALGGHPQLLQAQVNMFTHAIFEERALPRALREQISLVVSGINLSSYCLAAHLEILEMLGYGKPLARKLERQDFDRVKRSSNDGEITDGVLVVSLYPCAYSCKSVRGPTLINRCVTQIAQLFRASRFARGAIRS